MIVTVEVRKNDRDLRLPLNMDAPTTLVSKALGAVLEVEAGRLIAELERDYDGRMDLVRFTITLGVTVSANAN